MWRCPESNRWAASIWPASTNACSSLARAVVLDGDLREASAAASDQLADEGANAFKPAEQDEFGANPDDDFAQDALF